MYFELGSITYLCRLRIARTLSTSFTRSSCCSIELSVSRFAPPPPPSSPAPPSPPAPPAPSELRELLTMAGPTTRMNSSKSTLPLPSRSARDITFFASRAVTARPSFSSACRSSAVSISPEPSLSISSNDAWSAARCGSVSCATARSPASGPASISSTSSNFRSSPRSGRCPATARCCRGAAPAAASPRGSRGGRDDAARPRGAAESGAAPRTRTPAPPRQHRARGAAARPPGPSVADVKKARQREREPPARGARRVLGPEQRSSRSCKQPA